MSGKGFGSSAPSGSGRNSFGMGPHPSNATSSFTFGSSAFGRAQNGQQLPRFGRNPSNGPSATDKAVAGNDEPLISFAAVHKAMYNGGFPALRTTLMAKFNIAEPVNGVGYSHEFARRRCKFWRVVNKLCSKTGRFLTLKDQYDTATLSPEVLQDLEATLLDDTKKRKAEGNLFDSEMSPAKRQRKDSGESDISARSQSQFLRKSKKSVTPSPNVAARKPDAEPYKRNRMPPRQEDVIDLCNSSEEESSDEEDEDLQAALARSYWTVGQDEKKEVSLPTPNSSMDLDLAYNSWKEKEASKKPPFVNAQDHAAHILKGTAAVKKPKKTNHKAQDNAEKKKESNHVAPVARAIPRESRAFASKSKYLVNLGKTPTMLKTAPFCGTPELTQKKQCSSSAAMDKQSINESKTDEEKQVSHNYKYTATLSQSAPRQGQIKHVFPVDEATFISRVGKSAPYRKSDIDCIIRILRILNDEERGLEEQREQAKSHYDAAIQQGYKLPAFRSINVFYRLDPLAIAGLCFVPWSLTGRKMSQQVLPFEQYYPKALEWIASETAAGRSIRKSDLGVLNDPSGGYYYMDAMALKHIFPDPVPRGAQLVYPKTPVELNEMKLQNHFGCMKQHKDASSETAAPPGNVENEKRKNESVPSEERTATAQKTDKQEDEVVIPDMDEDAEIEVSTNSRKPSLWKRLFVWLLMMLVFVPIALVAFQCYEAWKKEKLAAEAKRNEWDFYKLKW